MGTLTLWSGLEYAGGLPVRPIKGWSSCRFGVSVDGESGLQLVLPIDHDALADIGLNSVFRVHHRGAPYQYRVMTFDDDTPQPSRSTASVFATPSPLHDLGFVYLRQILAGIPNYTLSGSLLTPLQFLNNFVIPALVEQGYPWFEAGDVTPTFPRTMEWDGETILSFLRRLVARDQVNVWTERNPATSKYKIHLSKVGAGSVPSVCRVGDNVTVLRRSISRETLATVVRATSPVQSGAVERDHIGAVEWAITARSGAQYTLDHPGGDTEHDPIVKDAQFNSSYAVARLREGCCQLLGGKTTSPAPTAFANVLGGVGYHPGTGKTFLQMTMSAAARGLSRWLGFPPIPEPPRKTVDLGFASLNHFGKWPFRNDATDRFYWPLDDAGTFRMGVWNPNTDALVSSTSLGITGGSAYDIDRRPTSGYLYFTGSGATDCWVYDPATDALITTVVITDNGLGLVYAATQDRVYIWCEDRKLRVLRPSDHTVTATLDLSSSISAGAAHRGIGLSGNFLYVGGRTAGNVHRVHKVDISSADSPSDAGSSDAIPTGDNTVRDLRYSSTLDRVVSSFSLSADGALTAGRHLLAWKVGAGFAYDTSIALYEHTAWSTYLWSRDEDGVLLVYLGNGVFVAVGSTQKNHALKAIQDSLAGTNQLVTLAGTLPVSQTDRIAGETAWDRGLLRISDKSTGDFMTELVNDGAVDEFDKVVREIRSEAYLYGDASSILNLLRNGGLYNFDADGFPYGIGRPTNRASSSPKGPRWTSPDADSGNSFSSGVTATWNSGRITTITVNGLPNGLVVQPGDRVVVTSNSYISAICGRVACTGTNDVLPIWRTNYTNSGSALAATLHRPTPASVAIFANGRDLLGIGQPLDDTFVTYEADGYTYRTSGDSGTILGAHGLAVLVSPPLYPRAGAQLYLGAEIGFMRYASNFGAGIKPGLSVYRYDGEATPVLEIYADDLPTSGIVLKNIYGRVIEGSIPLTSFHQPYVVKFVPGENGVQMFVKQFWAYVANESHATAIALDGVGPVYRLWRLGAQATSLLSDPQVNYQVAALEKTGKPFILGGDSRLVDLGRRNIDQTVRIVAVERELSEEDTEQEVPVLTVNNRENDLTARLVAAGVV